MLRVGLTGGIGSGKSTVAGIFAGLGVPVIDADDIAHRLTAPGGPGFHRIVEAFGIAILDKHHAIDRARLRTLVFDDEDKRRNLEAILHPLVLETMLKEAAQLDAPYCIFCIPLLVEAKLTSMVDRVLVIDADPEAQLQRVAARNDLPMDVIRKIIASQASRQQRLAFAHDHILNDADMQHLVREVERLHRYYTQLAAA
jgi:dephospho-CoA kinase